MRDNSGLGIIAGQGDLPMLLIKELQQQNQRFVIFLLKSETYEIDYSAYNPVELQFDEVTKLIDELKRRQIKNLTLAGKISKPNFSAFAKAKLDKKAYLLLGKILASKILGDDAVLKTVVKFFEAEGLTIRPINEFLPGLVTAKAVLTKLKPSAEDLAEIEIAKSAIHAMSPFDIGQAVIIAQRQIIAVEGIEGTDAMIKRVGSLKVEFRKSAILVKLSKLKQNTKVDLPAIGIETIKNCIENDIKGIAIEAKNTLILNKDELIKLADQHKLFIIAL